MYFIQYCETFGITGSFLYITIVFTSDCPPYCLIHSIENFWALPTGFWRQISCQSISNLNFVNGMSIGTRLQMKIFLEINWIKHKYTVKWPPNLVKSMNWQNYLKPVNIQYIVLYCMLYCFAWQFSPVGSVLWTCPLYAPNPWTVCQSTAKAPSRILSSYLVYQHIYTVPLGGRICTCNKYKTVVLQILFILIHIDYHTDIVVI